MMENNTHHTNNGVDHAVYNQIASMFQRPSQLEKIDELLKKAERKKVYSNQNQIKYTTFLEKKLIIIFCIHLYLYCRQQ
jgi:recombinational DNA repair protein RecT